jgi:tRNA 2-thiocytidine biosynthesis protein TtcA
MQITKSIEKQTPSKLEKKLESLLRKALYEYKIGTPPLAIALSGGKDSLTMLYLLKKISGKGFADFNMVALYVDGEFSCGPSITKSHLKNFCEELNIPFYPLESKKTLANLECYSCSRERRTLLFNKAKELGCTEIAFGHHQDDVIETLLLNLLHIGEFSSQQAKVPMYNYGITIVRPLYYMLEKDILLFAKQKGFFRFTCQCPIGATSKRRDVKQIIKTLENIFPNTKTNLFQALIKSGSDKSIRKKLLNLI